MPLSRFQSDILRLIASNRDPESYVAGDTPLNRSTGRYSSDIDIFHDRQERVAAAASTDASVLRDAGYGVEWIRQAPSVVTAGIIASGGATRLEWLADSDYRFFPTVKDQTFGYLLHPIDLAANKVMAAVGRRELRDLVDLVTIDKTILPLGALVWAVPEKSPGYTPEGVIAEIRRNSNYSADEWKALDTAEPLDPKAVLARLRAALDKAEAFVAQMPTEKVGLLFLSGANVVQPDPGRLQDYQTHAGKCRGHWPESLEITAAMFERAAQQKGNSAEHEIRCDSGSG